MPTLTLYRFRYRSTAAGPWVMARYCASEADIAQRHPHYELLDAEVREVPDDPYDNSMSRLGGNAQPL